MKTATENLSETRESMRQAEISISTAMALASPGARMEAMSKLYGNAGIDQREALAIALIARVAIASR